jgi:hypothetical protein
VAYAHPSSLLEAFRVEALWIGGTAVRVNPDRLVRPGIVLIFQSNGSGSEHTIPKDLEKLDNGRNVQSPDILGSSLSPEQLARIIERIQATAQYPSISGPGGAVDDNRPSLDVTQVRIGPFSAPLSRLRIALFPGEADHVELYDIRIEEECKRPLRTSVISRLPGYSPETVREIQNRVDIQGTRFCRYLPGTALAGQLRDGAAALDPTALSPKDLLGGVEIDLGQTLPPKSYVHLFYRVMPGHVFYAVVEPLAPAPTQAAPIAESHERAPPRAVPRESAVAAYVRRGG